jgi:hypothetical protein
VQIRGGAGAQALLEPQAPVDLSRVLDRLLSRGWKRLDLQIAAALLHVQDLECSAAEKAWEGWVRVTGTLCHVVDSAC